jgi:hypothetical protein
VDVPCTQRFASPSEHGHFVRVDLDVETPAGPQDDLFSLSPFNWSIVGTDGITETSLSSGPAYSCLPPNEQLPQVLNAGSRYRGAVVLDSANAAGTLAFRTALADQGWEWPITGA